MEKRPAGAKPAQPKRPAAAAPPKVAKEGDTAVAAENTVDPVNQSDPTSLGETEVFAGDAEGQADDDAASFLLDEQPVVKKAAKVPAKAEPRARPAPSPQDADTVMPGEDAPGAAPPEGPSSGATEMFTQGEEEEEAKPAAKPAPASRPAAAKPPAPAAKSAQSSQTLGKSPNLGDYRLLKKLGAGGMGTVYLAQQVSLDRQVALKVLSKELASKPAFVQRFLREARLMAKLDHPNILRSFDVGEAQGYHYLAMEFVDGGSVESWLKKLGKLSLEDALHLTLACARALEHAHEQNMVHRDIKPDNLLLTGKGVVKLADLGLAKAQDDDLSLTKTGTGAGTPLYMAPEQARDVKHVDGRSDIYSVGVMLYRFLTGELPFGGETLIEVIDAKQKGKFKPLRQLNPDVPQRLDLIVDKMLASNPSHRYQTSAELVADLEALGMASERLSFLGAAPAAKKKPAAAPAPAPSAARKTDRPAAVVSSPAAPRAPAAPASRPEPEEAGVWYVTLPLPGGRTVNKKATHEEVVTLIKNGNLTVDTPMSRSLNGKYRPLNSYPELNQVVKGLLVKAQADRKTHKYRELYAQIEKEDLRRQRRRWINNLIGRFGGFVGLLIGVAIIIGICVGGFFFFRWLIFFVGEKLHLD
jgi:hypothetical protein